MARRKKDHMTIWRLWKVQHPVETYISGYFKAKKTLTKKYRLGTPHNEKCKDIICTINYDKAIKISGVYIFI